MKKNKNRVNKWKEYRNTLESEEGIHFSIVNSSDELKKLFKSINFDIVEAYEKNNHNLHYLKENISISVKKEQKKINDILKKIENIDSSKQHKNIAMKNYNSHKYDELLKENFLEFIDKEKIKKEDDNIDTTNLKINKINIVEN